MKFCPCLQQGTNADFWWYVMYCTTWKRQESKRQQCYGMRWNLLCLVVVAQVWRYDVLDATTGAVSWPRDSTTAASPFGQAVWANTGRRNLRQLCCCAAISHWVSRNLGEEFCAKKVTPASFHGGLTSQNDKLNLSSALLQHAKKSRLTKAPGYFAVCQIKPLSAVKVKRNWERTEGVFL